MTQQDSSASRGTHGVTSDRRNRFGLQRVGLALAAAGLASVGAYAAHGLAMARQKPVVVLRFLAGYFDKRARFVPVAGRGATNVDRNAILMFICSGAIDMGPKIKATLPLTLAEQAELDALALKIRQGDDTQADRRRFRELGGDINDTFEPGVLVRRRSLDPAARVVATGSVSSESVRIRAQTSGGAAEATGAFFRVPRRRRRGFTRSRFMFNPRYTVATFNRPGEIDYNPEGFDALTEYSVEIDGGSEVENPLLTLTNLDDVPLAENFSTTFVTSDRYVQDFSRPEVRSRTPDGTNVPSDADIEITFSEPMDIASFIPPRFQDDDAATIRVRYAQDPINGSLAGRNVLVLVRVKPQTAGNVVQIRPLQTFGRGPHRIEVTISAAVTDLSGNNIIRQDQFTFDTVFDPEADLIDELVEGFEDNDQEDVNFTIADVSGDNLVADWNSNAFPGLLTTSVQEQSFRAEGLTPTGNVNVWFNNPVRWQMLYSAADMGGRARTLTGLSWVQTGTSAGNPPITTPVQSNLTYPNTQMRIGHAATLIAGGGFNGDQTNSPGPIATNFRDTPVTVVRPVNYTIPVIPLPVNGPFVVPGPTWERTFNTNGLDSVILEIDHAGNGTAGTSETWQIDNQFSINTMTFTLYQNTPVVTQSRPWYHTIDWRYLTPGAEARSNWYNTFQPAVRYVPQQIVPFTQPVGTVVAMRWQGAKADVNNDAVLDPVTITPWTTDIRTLASFPFVRFQVELKSNLATREAPRIEDLTIPFTYR